MNINNKIGLIMVLIFIAILKVIYATPIGPSITSITNETQNATPGTLINTTGGSITTMTLNLTQQNPRWKAYVGNVTGTLTLDDANSYTIYDWNLGTISGEVYATRNSSTVSWADINCSNATHINNEEIAMNHTNPDDNITTTFDDSNDEGFYVGDVYIAPSSCSAVHTYINDQEQSSDFEEVVLYDGTDVDNGKIIYATILEDDTQGFDTNEYDFQMIVPENGAATWSSSTAYYFYAEIT